MYEAFKDRRDYVHSRIQDIALVTCSPPEGGFYVFLDVRSLDRSSVSVAKHLLSEYGVVTVPGTGFGEAGEGHLRLSFANDKDSLATALIK